MKNFEFSMKDLTKVLDPRHLSRLVVFLTTFLSRSRDTRKKNRRYSSSTHIDHPESISSLKKTRKGEKAALFGRKINTRERIQEGMRGKGFPSLVPSKRCVPRNHRAS